MMVAADASADPSACGSPAVDHEAPAAEPALGEAGEEVPRLDAVGGTALNLAVGGPEIRRPGVTEPFADR
jgi:hypothetical protein